MKNIFNKFAFFIALSFVFISCGNLTTSENDDSIPQGKGKITISTDLKNHRSVLPTAIKVDTTGLKWELVGTKNGEPKTIKFWEDNNSVTAYKLMTSDSGIVIDTGTWDFTLTASNTAGKNVLSATISATINSGNNDLNFVMQEATGDTAATGSIEFTLNFPGNVVSKGIATLTPYEGTNSFTQEFTADEGTTNQFLSTIIYNKEDLSAGYYILKIELQQEKGDTTTPAVEYETINTYSCLIRVAPGLLSKGEYTLSNLAQLYTINYECNQGSFESQQITTSYNAYTSFALPTPTRDGYKFAGWYTEAELKNPVELDGNGKYRITQDTTLYAKWEQAVINLTQAVLDTYSTPNNDRYTLTSGEYCVTENLSLKYPIVIEGNVSIYSNADYTISVANNYVPNNQSWLSMIVISTANDTLTLGNGNGNLTIDGTTNSTTTLNYLVMSSGTFNLRDKVTITNGNVNYSAVFINGGTFTMTGGSIEYNNSKSDEYGAGIHVLGNPNATTVNISGGSVYNNYYSTNTNELASICNKGGNVTILGETLATNNKFTQNIINGRKTEEIPIRSWEELVTNIDSIPSDKTDTTKFLITNDLVVTKPCYNYSPVIITPVGNVTITTTSSTIFTPNANLTIAGNADNILTLQGIESANIGLIDSDCYDGINIALEFCNISNGYILVEQLENWTMTNCTIKNSSYDSGAFSLDTSGTVTIKDCSFESNTYDVYVKNSPSLTLNGTLKLPKIYYDNSLTGRDLGIVIGENLQLKDETKISIEIYSTDNSQYDIKLFNLADGQTVPTDIFTLVNESYQINSSTGEIEKIGGGN